MKDKNLQYYISYFLSTYISGERGLSYNTFLSYNYTFRQLAASFYETLKTPINKVAIDEFTPENIKDFLKSLEEHGCSAATRNQRLAAIKSFCKYVQMDSPKYLYNMQQILSIPSKREGTPVIQYLSAKQLEILLNRPDTSNRHGFKDLLLLTVLSDTGARVSEVINLKISDIRLDALPMILIHGKGNKNRWVPISDKTASLIRLYFDKENLTSPVYTERNLFLNRSGRPFTRAGIAYIIQKYVGAIHNEIPDEFPEKLTPHCLRHTRAMILLQAGQNLIYIRDLLGHEHIKTTEIYARINSKQIQDAINAMQEQISVPDHSIISYQDNPGLLGWLKEYCR